jgi:hypothetical protein
MYVIINEYDIETMVFIIKKTGLLNKIVHIEPINNAKVVELQQV